MGNNFKDLWKHMVAQGIFLCLWIIITWMTDHYMLQQFPLTGMSLWSYRVVQAGFHFATLRLLFRLVFPPRPPGPWWR